MGSHGGGSLHGFLIGALIHLNPGPNSPLVFSRKALILVSAPTCLDAKQQPLTLLCNRLAITVAFRPDIARFLTGVSQINHPEGHRFPTWDLHLVLDGLAKTPLEPIHQLELHSLITKTVLLVAMTLAKKVSELGAISVNDTYVSSTGTRSC